MAFFSVNASAQLAVTADQTVEWYVQNVLLGSGVTASNITFNGQPGSDVHMQCGYYQSNGSYIGIESGIVLSSGDVVGENWTGDDVIVGQETTINTTNGTNGDADLTAISGFAMNDIAILEFDFIPTGDTLRFNYIFASDEYPEYVDDFNDAFGFFIAGPGITGPYSSPAGFPGGSANIALVPGTTTPVAIGNVNEGDYFCGDTPVGCTNCEYYIDNCDNGDTEFDGLTEVLQAFSIVQCGETYHIKLAIADAGGPGGFDSVFDSAVFLQEGSFASDLVISATLFSSIGPYSDGFLYENCGYGSVVFSRTGGLDAESTVELVVTGVAENGVDYTTIPTEFEFPLGDSLYVLDVYAILDGLDEGLELVEVEITNTSSSACAQGSITSEFSFYVSDDPEPLQITTQDFDIECGDAVFLDVEVTGGYGQYQFDWSNGSDEQMQTIYPGLTTDYIITVSDTCNAGSVTDTSTVIVPVHPPLEVDLADTTSLSCLEVVEVSPLNVSGGDGTYSYEWSQSGEALGSDSPNLTYVGGSTDLLNLTVTDGCFIEASDQMLMLVPVIPIHIETTADTTICIGGSALLSALASGGEPPFEYEWSHFSSPDLSIVVAPRETSVYTVSVTDLCNNVQEEQIRVGVSETNAVFAVEDYGYYGVNLQNFSGGQNSDTLMYTWDLGDGTISNEESLIHEFNDLNDLMITLTVENEHGCVDTASIEVIAPPTVYVPTGFSPNNDGINDLFKVEAEGVATYELIIFDRWGQKVFESNDIEESWNGRGRQNSGYYGENDTFVYHLKMRLIDGQRVDTRGTITMLR